jgi:Ca2+-binding EF-hand superfamily protein
MRRARIVALIFLVTSVLILCPTSSVDSVAKGLPEWFKKLDTDEDGQISLREWREGGKKLDEFRKYDLNGDGFITVDEIIRVVRKGVRLKLEKGKVNHKGVIEVLIDEVYQGRRAYKILTIKLEQGKIYQIEMVSQMYWSHIFLESPDGELLAQHNSNANGQTARIVHRAPRTGVYRLIATSLGGFRVGPFSLTIRVLAGPGGVLPRGLPSWFVKLDKNQDGQISVREWQAGGKKLEEFRKYDLNGDGLITPNEFLWVEKRQNHLKLEKGRATHKGVIEEALDEMYQGRRTYKIFTIKMEQGKSYQI